MQVVVQRKQVSVLVSVLVLVRVVGSVAVCREGGGGWGG
jgi:hypothetical protein